MSKVADLWVKADCVGLGAGGGARLRGGFSRGDATPRVARRSVNRAPEGERRLRGARPPNHGSGAPTFGLTEGGLGWATPGRGPWHCLQYCSPRRSRRRWPCSWPWLRKGRADRCWRPTRRAVVRRRCSSPTRPSPRGGVALRHRRRRVVALPRSRSSRRSRSCTTVLPASPIRGHLWGRHQGPKKTVMERFRTRQRRGKRRAPKGRQALGLRVR
mgnify:CR=1 FL=1